MSYFNSRERRGILALLTVVGVLVALFAVSRGSWRPAAVIEPTATASSTAAPPAEKGVDKVGASRPKAKARKKSSAKKRSAKAATPPAADRTPLDEPVD